MGLIEGKGQDFVYKLRNCRLEIARWWKNTPPYGKEKINELKKALEEVQQDDNKTQDDILELSAGYLNTETQDDILELSAGYLNTEFYHDLTKQRRLRNINNWFT